MKFTQILLSPREESDDRLSCFAKTMTEKNNTMCNLDREMGEQEKKNARHSIYINLKAVDDRTSVSVWDKSKNRETRDLNLSRFTW